MTGLGTRNRILPLLGLRDEVDGFSPTCGLVLRQLDQFTVGEARRIIQQAQQVGGLLTIVPRKHGRDPTYRTECVRGQITTPEVRKSRHGCCSWR